MRALTSTRWLFAITVLSTACSGPGDAAPDDAGLDARATIDGAATDAPTDARPVVDAPADAPPDAPPDAPTDAGPLGSTGCGMPGDTMVARQTIRIGSTDRTYVLSVPEGYDARRPYPLVFAWHGRMATSAQGNGLTFRGGMGAPNGTTGGVELAADGAAIFVYPDGRPVTGPTGWGFDDREIDGPDYQLFDAILDEITSTYCVDEERVFSYGHSNGAYMSETFACRRPGVLRGIAPVAGGPPWQASSCPAGNETAVWLHNTRDDGVVDFDPLGLGARNYWHRRLACDEASEPVEPSPCIAYDGCARPFHWCVRESGGHGWPGAATGPAIWAFFTSL